MDVSFPKAAATRSILFGFDHRINYRIFAAASFNMQGMTTANSGVRFCGWPSL